MPPPPSGLDHTQILKHSFDETNGRLRVDASATIVTPPDIEVAIDHTEDSIAIGDGVRLAGVTPSGALKVDNNSEITIVDFLDNNVLDTSSINIPASSSLPLQVVASLAANTVKIRVADTTGAFIGIYTGSSSSEVLKAISGPGMDGEVELILTQNDRVSIKNMQNSIVSVGEYCIQFLG